MTLEELNIQTTLVVAQMAATLEAGDRAAYANHGPEDSGQCNQIDPAYYAKRAWKLYQAVDYAGVEMSGLKP